MPRDADPSVDDVAVDAAHDDRHVLPVDWVEQAFTFGQLLVITGTVARQYSAPQGLDVSPGVWGAPLNLGLLVAAVLAVTCALLVAWLRVRAGRSWPGAAADSAISLLRLLARGAAIALGAVFIAGILEAASAGVT